jgi:plastocyanin
MKLDKQEKILITVAVIIVTIIVIIIFWHQPAPVSQNNSNSSSSTVSQESLTHKSLTEAVPVPSVGQTNVATTDLAIPIATASEAPGINQSQVRAFNISITADQFSPSKVSVYNGDVVHIIFASTDKNYDVYQPDYGWLVTVNKGKSAQVVFTANSSGRFTFYCPSCGGPSKGPIGYIYVN